MVVFASSPFDVVIAIRSSSARLSLFLLLLLRWRLPLRPFCASFGSGRRPLASTTPLASLAGPILVTTIPTLLLSRLRFSASSVIRYGNLVVPGGMASASADFAHNPIFSLSSTFF